MFHGKKVIVVYGNGKKEEFPTVTSAAVALNISISSIRKKAKAGEAIEWRGQKIKFRFL